jgi:hypothetical protein
MVFIFIMASVPSLKKIICFPFPWPDPRLDPIESLGPEKIATPPPTSFNQTIQVNYYRTYPVPKTYGLTCLSPTKEL